MNYAQARAQLVGRLNTFMTANHPSIPVYYDNQTPADQDSVGSLYVEAQVYWDDSVQIDIQAVPNDRTIGTFFLTINKKEGDGMSDVLVLLGELKDLFKAQSLAGLQTKIPKAVPYRGNKGWIGQELMVPFWFDSNT